MLVQSTLFLFNFFKMTNFEDLVFALTEANNGNELLQAIDEYLAQQSALGYVATGRLARP